MSNEILSASVEQSVIATFDSPSGVYVADTCAPLRDAGARGLLNLHAYGRGSYPGEPIAPEVLPQLMSVGTWVATTDQDWGLDWHRNEGIEITCVTAGAVSFSCEDQNHDLVAGDVTITRPWQLHRVGRPNVSVSTLSWFILDVEVRQPNQEWVWPSWLPLTRTDLNRLTELLSHNEHPVWRANKATLAAISALERSLSGDVSQPLARIAAAITEVLIELGDLLEREQPALNPYLSSTERTVQLFLTNSLPERLAESWTVDQMAAECGLGKTRFMHYCRQMINISPIEHLTKLRITNAARLLCETDLRVTDIAMMSGFQSSQYFATTFKRHLGQRPLTYRGRRDGSVEDHQSLHQPSGLLASRQG